MNSRNITIPEDYYAVTETSIGKVLSKARRLCIQADVALRYPGSQLPAASQRLSILIHSAPDDFTIIHHYGIGRCGYHFPDQVVLYVN